MLQKKPDSAPRKRLLTRAFWVENLSSKMSKSPELVPLFDNEAFLDEHTKGLTDHEQKEKYKKELKELEHSKKYHAIGIIEGISLDLFCPHGR